MKKSQQFYILKFSSDRLKKSNFSINISLSEARKNGEVVTINNSEMIRALFRHKKRIFSQDEVDNLIISQKKLKKYQNSENNRNKLLEIREKLDSILFLEDFISIEFKNKSHYLTILKKRGFYVNGIRFVPFLASSGMIRKNTALFINNNLKHPMMDVLENDRNEKVPMVAAKFGAYFSLYSSSTLPVSFPRFAIVPDKEIETVRRVNLVSYVGVGEDDKVEEKDYLLKLNAWDGQGLITPNLARKWSEELELDYVFSSAVVRAPFLKGSVTVFDLEKFANEIAGRYTFTDIYGNEQDIRDIELIISESMFKLWNSYENTEDYVSKCHKNKLGFSIAKVNLKKEKSYSRTSYQFLQVLKLSDKQIADLCEDTISWFRDVSGNSVESMLLYANGEKEFDLKNFGKISPVVRAILLNPETAKDRYVQSKFISTITKKKKESYMGSILVNANYQFMIGDPFYQACHIFGVCDKHKPLLQEGEHYGEYWIERGIRQVCAIRSPIVHSSEINVLNLKDTEDTRKWYSHIHSGIIFPANGIGVDCAIHGGADFDGDLICTINNSTMITGRQPGYPIIYESQKSEKTIVDSRDDAKQVECQLNGYNSKVGFATNISSSLYTMLDEFPQGSIEYETIEKRLKIGRVIQGEIIDGVKGLKVPPFREHWTKATKITDEMSQSEIEKSELYNRLVCRVRPSFFRFLYPHYMTRYRKEIKSYDIYCLMKFGKSFQEIISEKTRTEEQEKLLENYKLRSFFLENGSTMNKISQYMRTKVSLAGRYTRKLAGDFDYSNLINNDIEINAYYAGKMKEYLQEYKKFKTSMRNGTNTFENMQPFISYLKKKCYSEISSNESELANYAVEVTYNDEISMVEFAWEVFPEGLIENIMLKSSGKIRIPVQSPDGEIEYLWNRYTFKEIGIEALYEE